jgi:energy-coupling factor transporter ATP-binding protein EcfA2
MESVSFDEVAKVYPDGTRAVSDFDLEISDGEFMVLVGPSGSGKTTALRKVAGLAEIFEGVVLIGDRVVNHVSSSGLSLRTRSPGSRSPGRDTEGSDRGRADRRCLRDLHLRARHPAARSAGDRLARDLPVPLDVERSARRADARPLDSADHGRNLLAAAYVRFDIDIIAAATFVSLIVPLAVFFAFQRYFVQGLLAGSVK